MPRTQYEQLVFRHGARQWGVAMWIVSAVVSPLYDAFVARESGVHAGARLLVGGVLSLPVWLWMGHWFGRGLAAFFGVEDSPPAV